MKRLANNVVVGNKILSSVEEEEKDKDDIPDLVENFENVATSDTKAEVETAPATAPVITEPIVPVVVTEEKKPESAPAPPTAAAETKKETTPKKSNEKGGKKQSKDKKA